MASNSRNKNLKTWRSTSNRFEFISVPSRPSSPPTSSPCVATSAQQALATRHPDSSNRDHSKGYSTYTRRKSNDASIFVANLPHHLPDGELESLLIEHFDTVAKVRRVKVLHDPKVVAPYAFVHFEDPEGSRIAVEQRSNSQLAGRTIRCEPANAHRTLLISLAPNESSNSTAKLEWIRLRRDKGSKFVYATFNNDAKSFSSSDFEKSVTSRNANFTQDPLSGNGVLISFDRSNISKVIHEVVTAFGPLESITTQAGPTSPTDDAQEAWIVKYEQRSDAVSAFTTLRDIPHIHASWQHLNVQPRDSPCVLPSSVQETEAVRHLARDLQESFHFPKYRPGSEPRHHNELPKNNPGSTSLVKHHESRKPPALLKTPKDTGVEEFPPLGSCIPKGIMSKSPVIKGWKRDPIKVQHGHTKAVAKSVVVNSQPIPDDGPKLLSDSSSVDDGNLIIRSSESSVTNDKIEESAYLPDYKSDITPPVFFEQCVITCKNNNEPETPTVSALGSPDSSILDTPKNYHIDLPHSTLDGLRTISIEVSTPTPPSCSVSPPSFQVEEIDETRLSVPTLTFTVDDEDDYAVDAYDHDQMGCIDVEPSYVDRPLVARKVSHSRSISDTALLDSRGPADNTVPTGHETLQLSPSESNGGTPNPIFKAPSRQSSMEVNGSSSDDAGHHSHASSGQFTSTTSPHSTKALNGLDHSSVLIQANQSDANERDGVITTRTEAIYAPLLSHNTPATNSETSRPAEYPADIGFHQPPLRPQGYVSTENGLIPIYGGDEFSRHMSTFQSSVSLSSSPGHSPLPPHAMNSSPWVSSPPHMGWMPASGFYPAPFPFMVPTHPMIGAPTPYVPVQQPLQHFPSSQYPPQPGYYMSSNPTPPIRYDTRTARDNELQRPIGHPPYLNNEYATHGSFGSSQHLISPSGSSSHPSTSVEQEDSSSKSSVSSPVPFSFGSQAHQWQAPPSFHFDYNDQSEIMPLTSSQHYYSHQ